MSTFAEFGIPFPLFEAPTSEASEYVGESTCRLCGGQDQHCFELGIGDAIILHCPSCGEDNGLNAHRRKDTSCRSCGQEIPFPEQLKAKKNIYVCYPCLRAGKGAMTKDTEFGAVSWEQASQGITHGAPGLKTDEFELVEIDPDEEWYGVRIPSGHLFELLRTPTFHTWQGESWLFCCKQPMIYVGEWENVSKSQFVPDDKRGFVEDIVHPDARNWVWDGISTGNVCLYLFHCKTCNRFRSTCDMD